MTQKTFPSPPTKTTPEKPILEHGMAMFMREGLRGFTVEALARELLMSKKTIYKYFPTKELLFKGMFSFVSGNISRWMEKLVNSPGHPLDKFKELVHTITKTSAQVNPSRLSDIKARYPDLWRDIETFRLERRGDLLALMQAAQTEGYIRESLDLELTATLFMQILNSVFQPEFFINNQISPPQAARTFLDVFFRGLMTQKGLNHIKDQL